jgi:3-oxoacyl-[acyl-carrier-protein] synthase-3
MSGEITDIKYFLPKNKVDIKKLCKKYNWPYNKTLSATGIKYRYESNKKQTALDLALSACKKLKINNNVDAIIYVTQSPEYLLPTTACIIQDKLNLRKDILAFDINQGCSGFVYGLFTSFSFLKYKEIKNVLLICSDTYSKYIKKGDRSCETIFSDAASAIIIKKNPNKKSFFSFGTNGSGSKNLIVKNSGSNFKKNLKPEIFMDGQKVFLFTMSNIPKFITDLLKKNKTNINEIKYFVFHQASKMVIDNLIRRMDLPKNKVFCNYDKIGNTVSSSIPIALSELLIKNKIKKGDKLLLCGFGVGYSLAAAIIQY